MARRISYLGLGVLIASLAGAEVVKAAPISVGAGSNQAHLYVEFKDGASYEFLVSFDGTTTGLGLFDIVEGDTSLATVRENFGFGEFIDGISFGGHSNTGYGGGEDWWHYWIKDGPSSSWSPSFIGAGDRIVLNGYSDSWVYGRDGFAPEPASLVLLMAGGWLFRPRRRH